MSEATFYDKLRAVMGDVAYLEKKGYNAHFKYAFVTEAQVKAAVSAGLRKHGLNLVGVTYDPVGECTGKVATLRCTVTIGDGTTSHSFQGIGAGADSSDKAPMKACAAALKYALTSAYLIETGDDPEEDGGTASKGAPATQASKPKDEGKAAATTNAATALAFEAGIAAIKAAATTEALALLRTSVGKLRAQDPTRFDTEVKPVFLARQAELIKPN